MTPSHITTDDGREIDTREILDMAPTEPHSHAEYVPTCWACLGARGIAAAFGEREAS